MKKKVKLLVVDVDGTMTDAGIYYDEHGNELKKFCTKDAAGFFAAHKSGIKIMVLKQLDPIRHTHALNTR